MGFLENIFGNSLESAYKKGVEQTSGVINIYVDPDIFEDALASAGIDYDRLSVSNNFSRNYDDLLLISPDEAMEMKKAMGEILEESLEKQQPGITQAILDKASKFLNEEVDMGQIAIEIMSRGPATVDNIHLNGEIYGIAVLPANFVDSKNEFIDFLLYDSDLDNNTIKVVKGNMPGTDTDWARIIGFHEGQHLDAEDTGDGSVNTLKSEVEADQRIITEIRANINSNGDENIFFDEEDDVSDQIDPEMLLVLKDLRALGNSKNDPEHATTPLLDSGDQASSLHIEVAKIYKNHMFKEVNENFDFDSYEGNAKNAKELLKENPEAFFSVVNDGLSELRTQAINAYKNDPLSFENRATIVSAQILTDYINDYEDAYRRRVLGQDIPEKIHSAQFLPQEVENEFYADLRHENAINALEQEDRKAARYDRNEAFKSFDWEKYEGKAKTPDDLYVENKGLYYITIKEDIEALKESSIEDYAKNPSQENLARMIEVEHIIGKIADDINPNLKRALGDDAPQLSTESFVPEDKKREYYEARLSEIEAKAKATDENIICNRCTRIFLPTIIGNGITNRN